MRRGHDAFGTKHRLLLYRRLAGYYRTPLLLLMLVSGALLLWNHAALQQLRLVLVVAFAVAWVLLLLTTCMSLLAYVQCREDGLRVQLPFYRLHVPYELIRHTRSVVMYELFPPSKQAFSARGFLAPLWNLPAVIVYLEYLPRRRRHLRLWMDSRMVIRDGLVLLLDDPRAFRRHLDDAMIKRRTAGRGLA